MSNVRFIGCLHLGHKSIAIHRGFNDDFYHDEKLIDSWNSVVNKKDLTYILGDIAMETDKHYYKLNRLKGRKIVVLGNHDLPKHTRNLLNYVESVAGMVKYKGYVLTHAPIHPNEIGFCKGNIHAHVHDNKLHEVEIMSKYLDEDSVLIKTLHKYHCVDAKLINFKPISLEELEHGKIL
jgi:calcineurin-like phosphoesterase family protein